MPWRQPLAAIFSNLKPLFATLLSAMVLGATPQPYDALVFLLIVAGTVMSNRRPAA